MALFSIIVTFLMALAVICVQIFVVLLIILAIVGFVKKDFSIFKKFSKYFGYLILGIVLLIVIWGLVVVVNTVMYGAPQSV